MRDLAGNGLQSVSNEPFCFHIAWSARRTLAPPGQIGSGPRPSFNDLFSDVLPAGATGKVLEGSCPVGQEVIASWAVWVDSNDALQIFNYSPVDAGDPGTIQVYTTGVPIDDQVRLQYTCATVSISGLDRTAGRGSGKG